MQNECHDYETPSTETTILSTVNYDLQEQVSSKMTSIVGTV